MLLRRTSPDASLLLRSGESGAFVFVATSSAIDRMGDVIEPDGVSWASWRANPVILASHNSSALPVARGANPTRIRQPDGWSISIQFPTPGAARASDEARALVEAGVLSAVSVGFKPTDSRAPTAAERKRGVTGKVFTRSEILEVSLVSIPANPEALRLKCAELVRKGLVSSDLVNAVLPGVGPRSSSCPGAAPSSDLRERIRRAIAEELRRE